MSEMEKLADEARDMAAFYMERPRAAEGANLSLAEMSDRECKAVASLLLRVTASLRQHATALEIGRGIGREEALAEIVQWCSDERSKALAARKHDEEYGLRRAEYEAQRRRGLPPTAVDSDRLVASARAVLASLAIKNG